MDTEKLKRENPIAYFVNRMRIVWEVPDEDEELVARTFLRLWPSVKTAIREQYNKEGILKKSLDDFSVPAAENMDQDELDMDFFNMMVSMDCYLHNTGRHQETISYIQDLLVLFDWSDDDMTGDSLRSSIGEAYDAMGLYDERDRYFDSLLADEKNEVIASNYALCLLMHKEIKKAEQVLEPYKDSDDELIQDRFEMLRSLKNS